MPHTVSKIPAALAAAVLAAAGALPQLPLYELDKARAHVLGLLARRRLHHDPDERLGATGPYEHPSAARERRLGGAHAPLDTVRPLERSTVAHTHVHQPLRQPGHHV